MDWIIKTFHPLRLTKEKLLYISTINARFFDYCRFLFEWMIDAQISYKTQRIVQKSIVMEKLAMFLLEIVVWESPLMESFALGGGEKSNKVATEDYQKVLLERLTQWPTQ